jgi:membrane protein HdeD
LNILLKLLVNGIIAVPGLLWSGTSLSFALVTSAVVSLVAYGLGDAVILPRTNNTFASTADFALVFSLFWLAAFVFAQPFRLSGLFLTAFAISVAEYFFHDYLQRHGVHHTKHPG